MLHLSRHDNPILAQLVGCGPGQQGAVHGQSDGAGQVTLRIRRRQAGKTVREFVLDIVGRQLPGPEPGLIHDGGQEWYVLAKTLDMEVFKRAAHHIDGTVAGPGPCRELRDHRVIEHGDLVALADAGVIAHLAAGDLTLLRRIIPNQTSDGGQKAAIGILGVDPALHGPTVNLEVALLERQGLAMGRPDHLLDKVDAGDQLGNRMLHLQPGVHFQEVQALVLPGDELDGSRAVVLDGLGQGHGLGAHGGARRLVEQRARRLFDDFLIAPLNRTFPLEQMDHMAVPIAQNLDFDVTRALDELFDEDPVIAETGLGFRPDRRESFLDVLAVPGDANSFPATARRGLDHHRVADLLGDLDRVGRIIDFTHMSRHDRDAGLGRKFLAFDLVAHRLDRVRVGADEHDTFVGAASGECGVL